MRIAKVVVVIAINAFLAGFFLAQYIGRTGGAADAPATWLLLTIAFAALAVWRVRMIWRAERRATRMQAPPPASRDDSPDDTGLH
jgi:hypothetical protein